MNTIAKFAVALLLITTTVIVNAQTSATDLNKQLTNAVYEGNFKEAKRLIKAGADVNGNISSDPDDHNMFIFFITGHHEDAVKFLLAHGADVNQKTDGSTPMQHAEFVHGYGPPTDIIPMLKKAIANPKKYTSTLPDDQTPTAKKTKKDPLGLGQATLDKLKGKKVPYHKWNRWGNPKTLSGTNNQRWVAYLPKANVSFISEKGTHIITYITFGKGAKKEAKKVPKWVKKQFSGWSGSHINLTKHIKENLNDPSSYKHVETTYSVLGDQLQVWAKFRAKNAYGGKVLNSVKATVDKNGKILTAEWE